MVYCDFHGHSRKNNVFMYGCSDRKDASQCLQERVFPLMMSKNAKDKVGCGHHSCNLKNMIYQFSNLECMLLSFLSFLLGVASSKCTRAKRAPAALSCGD